MQQNALEDFFNMLSYFQLTEFSNKVQRLIHFI